MKTFRSITTHHHLTDEEKKQIKTVKSMISEMYDSMYKYVGENHTIGINGNVIRVKEIGDVIHVLSVLENAEEIKYLGSEEVEVKY